MNAKKQTYVAGELTLSYSMEVLDTGDDGTVDDSIISDILELPIPPYVWALGVDLIHPSLLDMSYLSTSSYYCLYV